MAWLFASLLRLRDGQAHTLALAALVAALAFAAVLAPRYLAATADGLLHETLSEARAEVRDLAFVEEWRISGSPSAPFALVNAAYEHFARDIPADLAAVLRPATRVIDSPRWVIVGNEPAETTIRLRFQEGAASQIRLVAGRMPTERTVVVERDDDPEGTKPPVVVFEAIVSEASAAHLGAGLGDRFLLDLDRSDRLAARQVSVTVQYDNRNDARVGIEVVGVAAVVDPAADPWFDDPAFERPIERSLGGDVRFQDVTVLLDDSAYPPYFGATDEAGVPMRYTWRLGVERPRITNEALPRVMDALRRIEAIFPTAGTPLPIADSPTLRTALLGLLVDHAASWRSIAAVLAIVIVGAAAIAVAALTLTTLLVARRRRVAAATFRRRGASGGQVVASAIAEGLVVAGPAAAVGALVAVAIRPAGSPAQSVAIAAAVAAAAALLLARLLANASAAAERPGGRPGPLRSMTGARRLVSEAGLVVVAAGAAYLARERGLASASAAGTLDGPDPLVTAAPALVGIAVGAVAFRIFPVPAAALAWLAARRRDLVPGLAMRRLARGSTAGPLLVVLLASAAIATFSSSALLHVARAADAVADREVGVPFRIDATDGPLGAALDPLALPAVRAAAPAFVGIGSLLNGARLDVMAVDPIGLAAVAPDAVTGGIPPEFAAAPDAPLPALVSTGLASAQRGLEVGKTFTLTTAGFGATYRIVGLRDTFPSIDSEEFVILSHPQLVAALPAARLAPNRILLDAPDHAGPAIRTALAAVDPRAVLAGRAETAEALLGTPQVEALRSGVAAATVAAALFAAAAAVASLVLVGAAQAAELGQLRALGLTRRGAVGLLALEQLPTIAVAFAGGAALGLGLFALVRPGLGLEVLVGGALARGIEPGLALEPSHLGATLLVAIAVVALGIAIAALLQRRIAPAAAMRQAADG